MDVRKLQLMIEFMAIQAYKFDAKRHQCCLVSIIEVVRVLDVDPGPLVQLATRHAANNIAYNKFNLEYLALLQRIRLVEDAFRYKNIEEISVELFLLKLQFDITKELYGLFVSGLITCEAEDVEMHWEYSLMLNVNFNFGATSHYLLGPQRIGTTEYFRLCYIIHNLIELIAADIVVNKRCKLLSFDEDNLRLHLCDGLVDSIKDSTEYEQMLKIRARHTQTEEEMRDIMTIFGLLVFEFENARMASIHGTLTPLEDLFSKMEVVKKKIVHCKKRSDCLQDDAIICSILLRVYPRISCTEMARRVKVAHNDLPKSCFPDKLKNPSST